MMKCHEHGHEIVALANLYKIATEGNEDADSFCFQSVGQEIVPMIAECMELPLIRRETDMKAKVTSMAYEATEGDEVEDLYELVKEAKEKFPEIQAVTSGAIFSDYQRVRVENVCSRLGLISLGYLWRRNQTELLSEMNDANLHAILIKVASLGLTSRRHLGKSVTSLMDNFEGMREKFGLNVCGEGGEYETLTLDCPLFKKRIVIDESHVHTVMDDGISEVALFIVDKCHVEAKSDVATPGAFAAEINEELATLPPLKLIQRHVHLSGITAPGASSVESEVAAVMDEIQSRLKEVGASMNDVVFVHLFVSDMKQFGIVNGAYMKYFGVNPPSRACVEILFADSSVHVMADCFAQIRSGERINDDRISLPRHVLHVQSISEWAPTCIGPYSQANVFGGLIFQAGQIGLDPASMKITQGGLVAEATQAFENIKAVYGALKSDISTTYGCTIYIDRHHDSPASRRFVLGLAKEYLSPGCYMYDLVVVPELPKGAAIEVEVLGRTTKNTNVLKLESVSLEQFDNVLNLMEWDHDDEDLKIGINGMAVKTGLLCATFSMNTAIKKSALFRDKVDKQLQALLQLIDECVHRCRIGFEKLLHVRVFYPAVLKDGAGKAFSDESAWLHKRLQSFVASFPVVPASTFIGCHGSQGNVLLQVVGRDLEAYDAVHWLQDYPFEETTITREFSLDKAGD